VKKVLVITYYWPPSGGAGVQRWLKFTKYLPEFDWQPVVYTPENPEAPVDDDSLTGDIHPVTTVLKRRIWEPYGFYKRFMGGKQEDRINAGFLSEKKKSHRKEGISVWIRGNLFIPDARKFWIRPSVRMLSRYLRQNPVDAVISTGPPHSMHLIARRLKQRLNIPWIADFRDPWTEIDYYDQLRLTPGSDRKHKTLEAAVLTEADRVIVIGNTMAERFRETHGIDPVIIPNGYDDPDFELSDFPEPGKDFTIVHVGAMNQDRNHLIFWATLAELLEEDPSLSDQLKLKLVGKLDTAVHQDLRRMKLGDLVETIPYLPHNRIGGLLKSATLLYLPINNTPNARSIQTGKLSEYLAARRPILGIGPVDGDAAHIIREFQAGEMVNFGDKESLKKVLKNLLEIHAKGGLPSIQAGIERFSRKNLTRILGETLDRQIKL
jgi:glycosyltransferase involved in cell wall biosynthesis